MRLFKRSLYWRLLVWFCVANLLVLVLGGLLAGRLIADSSAIEINWEALAQEANDAYASGGHNALAAWVAQQRQQGIDATLFEHGRPLYPIHLYPQALRAQLPEWLASGRNVVVRLRPGLYVAVQQITGQDGQSRQLLALSHSRLRLRPHEFGTILFAIQLLLSLLFIGLVGWWVARSVARPVEALRRATQSMADGELSTRVGKQGRMAHYELAELARDFDTMAERIEALVAHDRGVLQDLSHELRSPLARLQLILDLARGSSTDTDAARYFGQAEQEITRLDRTLGDMLTLSRMESGLPGIERERLDLADLVRECLAQSRLKADARHVEFRLTSVDSAMVSGNAMLLDRALDNLLANAIKFSPEGDLIEVILHTDTQAAELSLRDHGPGVPAEELALLFRPFYRGSNAKRAEGHGLGLTIVQRVVHVHCGSIDARNAEGGGLEVRLRLPLA
ncbi:MAG: ATP-binding protein [Rhodanobacteraceae bacterium]